MSRSALAPIRLLVVDDHALFREGLSRLLESHPGFSVVGTSESVSAGLDQVARFAPDLVLLDVDLGRERALEFMREVRRSGYSGKVLIVTAGVTDLEAAQLVHAGVSGIFHKHNPPEALCAAIDKVAKGEVVVEQHYLKGLFAAVDPQANDPRPRLSERDVEVLRHLLQGLANKEIGARMGLSESSVKAILRALFDKLGVRTRSQLVKVALDQYRAQL